MKLSNSKSEAYDIYLINLFPTLRFHFHIYFTYSSTSKKIMNREKPQTNGIMTGIPKNSFLYIASRTNISSWLSSMTKYLPSIGRYRRWSETFARCCTWREEDSKGMIGLEEVAIAIIQIGELVERFGAFERNVTN